MRILVLAVALTLAVPAPARAHPCEDDVRTQARSVQSLEANVRGAAAFAQMRSMARYGLSGGPAGADPQLDGARAELAYARHRLELLEDRCRQDMRNGR